jgi:UDP-glucose 4-epimerase
MKEKIIVTGGAGFIGSHMVDRLLTLGNQVTVIDNLSSGKMEFLKFHAGDPNFKFVKLDILEKEKLKKTIAEADMIYHFAANPDVRLGAEDTGVHLEQNIIATYDLLEAMRVNKLKNIVFTSTSTVWRSNNPHSEEYGPYPYLVIRCSKLACEALITSYCHTFEMNSWIFRFANIVGPRSTHGIIVDFINKLGKIGSRDPGDGQQKIISSCF